MAKELKTVDEVRAEFSGAQLDRWIMVGYRQWFKRKYAKKGSRSRELKLNRKLKTLSRVELLEKLENIKKRLTNKQTYKGGSSKND